MRNVKLFNDGWIFTDKEGKECEVLLPHTWNDIDGQDGGNDYYRGTCVYKKRFPTPKEALGIEPGGKSGIYLEFRGVNSSAQVELNGNVCAVHDGGYSTFRVELKNLSREEGCENEVTVRVDNAKNDRVYPQKADFTFYGGIYRDVYLISVPQMHFALDYYGGPGIQITPKAAGANATVKFRAYITDREGVKAEANTTGVCRKVRFTIDGIGTVAADIHNGIADAEIEIENARLWKGRKDPYLYRAKAELLETEMTAATESQDRADYYVVDEVSVNFGCRSFDFNSEKGFILNGQPYPLRGVSRHQDRKGAGNAITNKMQDEDMALIMEMGANTIRLAHYQHDQYFYDLCDKYGLVVWTEIPYISEHMPDANDNIISQLTELIIQNYNHPSIVCWGLSNEISVTRMSDDLRMQHKRLNDLAHRLDPTRPTTMAHVNFLNINDPLVHLTDICSFNLYFGWYFGELEDNEKWFDEFHAAYPDRIIGLSEYGADANLRYQNNAPEKGDYSEQFQCVYHEHMLRVLTGRPYIWASHVWNMFDFGADGRNEGGEQGLNQKGLVSFDRKMKKDAFYLYKAYLSDEPFVHICGSRYIDRTEEVTEIKVYSNQSEVSLYDNGELIGRQHGHKVFVFSVKLSDVQEITHNPENCDEKKTMHEITARAGNLSDGISIRRAAEPNPSYTLIDKNINNWYDNADMEFPEGYYSIKDTLGSIKQNPQGKVLIDRMIDAVKARRGDVAQGLESNEMLEKMLNDFSVETLIRQTGGSITPNMAVTLNKELTKIKKE